MNLAALDTCCNLCICDCFISKVPLTLKSLLTASLHNKGMWPTEWCQLHSAPYKYMLLYAILGRILGFGVEDAVSEM